MKKRNFFAILFIVLCIFLFMDRLIEDQYGINFIQYVDKSEGLTQEENEWLTQHNTIIYGADQNSPPLRYVDSENKQYKGITIDLIQALSIEIGTEIKLKPLVFKDALESLDKGQIDILDIFPSYERSKKYLFSDPIYNLRAIILVAADNDKIKVYEDIKNKKIAVIDGDYAIEYLNSNLQDIHFEYTKDMEHAIKLLISGKVDCVVGDEPVVSYFIDALKCKEKVAILDTPLYEKGVVLAIPKSEEKLLSIINKGVLGIKRKKVAEKIQQKWFGISAPISKEGISRKILINIGLVSSVFFLILYILYYWNEILKEKVNKQTEELFISRNDLQKTFDGVSYFMIVVDKDYTIVNANKAFCSYMKVNTEDVIKMKYFDFPESLYNGCMQKLIDEVFTDGNERKCELKVNDKIFHADIFPLEDKKKKIIKALLAIKDVTDFKINEKRLLQADKMAAVGQLAAGVAHEIRNPLGIIRNYTYVIKGQVKEQNEKVVKSINAIEASVNRASNIIDNLLNFSRMSGDIEKEVDIKEVLENILSLEKKVMEKLNIKLILQFDEKIVCRINDESLNHILINLISNAIDAMQTGGVLTIRCCKSEKKIYFFISDTGVGIKKEDLDNIFHPFFTTKAPGKGTGLGLYIAYNEVQRFGGEIRVTSQVNKGSTFKLILPLVSQASENGSIREMII